MASGVQITGLIKPLNGGSFPVFEDTDGLGGWRAVANVAARDAIPSNYRKIGMVVVDQSQNPSVAYQLVGGILNANWQLLAALRIADEGSLLPAEPRLNFVNATIDDSPGTSSTDLTLHYQEVQGSDGAFTPRKTLKFSNDFSPVDDSVGDLTRIDLTRPPLPSVGATDAGEILQVSAAGGGTWVTAANGFLSFATIALRNSYAGLRTAGMLTYVSLTQCLYMLAPDLITWNFYASSPALGSQTAWFVDPTGSDSNDGLTFATALLSTNELKARLGNGNQFNINQNITITINRDGTTTTYPKLQLNLATNTNSLCVCTIVCGITSTTPITLSAGTTAPVASTNTRGQLTTLAGTFVSKERIRLTSGASSGAVAYSTGLNVGVLNTFCSGFYFPMDPTFAVAPCSSAAWPAIGATCVIDTLQVTFSRIELSASVNTVIILQDAKFNAISISGCNLTGGIALGGGNVVLQGCIFASTNGRVSNTSNGAIAISCRVPATGKTALEGNNWTTGGCVVQGRLSVGCGSMNSYGITVDGGNIEVGVDADFNHPGAAPNALWNAMTAGPVTIYGACEVENGIGVIGSTAGAINIYDNGTLRIDDSNSYFWGASTAYSIGFMVLSGGWVYVSQNAATLNAILAIPSTINQSVADLSFAYSNTPIVFSNENCGITWSGRPNVRNNFTDSSLYLTLQNGNIVATSLIANPSKGLHDFYAYVAITVADAAAVGTPVLNVIFTDDSGVARTVPIATGSALTALGGGGGSAAIESNGSTPIQYSLTGVVTPGTSKFSVRIVDKLVSAGP